MTHHNGVLELFDAGADRTRAVWTAGGLPNALAKPFGALMGQGLEAMRRHLESGAAVSR